MRWRHIATGLFSLTMMTGCPSEFGRDGRVNKAVQKDAKELIQYECPEDIFEEHCSEGRENTPECLKECG